MPQLELHHLLLLVPANAKSFLPWIIGSKAAIGSGHNSLLLCKTSRSARGIHRTWPGFCSFVLPARRMRATVEEHLHGRLGITSRPPGEWTNARPKRASAAGR